MTPAPAAALLRPARVSTFPLAWQWLNEFPLQNFDDYGPTTEEQFCAEMKDRMGQEEIFEAIHDGAPVGIIGYLPITMRMGYLHGICFTRSVHHTGIPFQAMTEFLDSRYRSGVEKISASYHADNVVVRTFLKKLGAVDEGLLLRETMRNGKPLDKYLVAFHRGGR